jgi:hypothetical protein
MGWTRQEKMVAYLVFSLQAAIAAFLQIESLVTIWKTVTTDVLLYGNGKARCVMSRVFL